MTTANETTTQDGGDFIRVSAAKARYFGGTMSLRWWYRQIEEGRLPHYRAGGAVLLRPADVEAFVSSQFHDKAETESAGDPTTAQPPPTPGHRTPSARRGLRFFRD